MRLRQILAIIAVDISLLSLLFLGVLRATSQTSGIGGGVANSIENNLPAYSGNSIEAPLAGTQVSTKTIEAYIPFKEYRFHYVAVVTGMPSGTYTWEMQQYPPETLSDLHFNWTGGSGCNKQPNNNIVCGSGINYFFVEFRYSSPYSPTSSFILVGAGGYATGFSPNHTATLNYVEPLVFITSTLNSTKNPIEPLMHNGSMLQWQVPNIKDGSIVSTFYDPRIRLVYLPFVVK